VGSVDCLVFVNSPEGEQQFELAVSEETIEDRLVIYEWYRVFRLVVYGLMALAALLALIVSIRRHRLPKVMKILGKAGLVSVFLYAGAVVLMLIATIGAEDLPDRFSVFSTTQWLVACGVSAVAVVSGAIYVIRKTNFLEQLGDQTLLVKSLSVCISVFGLFVGGWALWEAVLKNVPSIIISILLLAVVVGLFVLGIGGLLRGLQEELKTPREKLAGDIARAIKEQEDDD